MAASGVWELERDEARALRFRPDFPELFFPAVFPALQVQLKLDRRTPFQRWRRQTDGVAVVA